MLPRPIVDEAYAAFARANSGALPTDGRAAVGALLSELGDKEYYGSTHLEMAPLLESMQIDGSQMSETEQATVLKRAVDEQLRMAPAPAAIPAGIAMAIAAEFDTGGGFDQQVSMHQVEVEQMGKQLLCDYDDAANAKHVHMSEEVRGDPGMPQLPENLPPLMLAYDAGFGQTTQTGAEVEVRIA